MRVLPLYPSHPASAVEAETPLARNSKCDRCEMHQPDKKPLRSICMDNEEAEWEDGDLLIIGEHPFSEDDLTGRPFSASSRSGNQLHSFLSKNWTRGYLLDNAVRCAPGTREVKEKHVKACRGYLAKTLQDKRPGRIIALGGWAAYSLLGRTVAPFSNRRGYSWLYGYGEPIPVFFVLHPSQSSGNRFIRKGWEDDMRWALTAEVPYRPPVDSKVRIVTSGEEARGARRELSKSARLAFDVETCGIMFTDSFRLLCVSFCADENENPIAWDEEGLQDPEVRAELVHLLADNKVRKFGANVKYDELACESALGVRPRNVRGDVRLWRKLLEPEADARLERMAELVGMGGMKEEAQRDLEATVKRVQKAIKDEKRVAKNTELDRAKAASGQRVNKRAPLKPEAAQGIAYWHRLQKEQPAITDLIKEDPSEWGRWAYGLAPRPLLLRYNARDTVATKRLHAH
jgi:uracil-DNA glycosylase family 4